MPEKPTHQDWLWFSWFLGKQKDWTPIINSGFSTDYTHETLSMLNLTIRRLNANKSVLERAAYGVKTPGQARLVYREQVRNRDLLHELTAIRDKILVQLKQAERTDSDA